MTIVDTARITSKGQITIPNRIRKILRLSEGSSLAFGVGREGVLLMPCKVTADSVYTEEEWAKIEKLAAVKGKVYKSSKSAKKHIQGL